MQKKAYVLLSGGLDSTTCLHTAIFDLFPGDPDMALLYGDVELLQTALRNATGGEGDDGCDIPWVEAVSIFYGQRHKRELTFAKKTCDRLGIKHTILDVGDLLKGKNI